MQEVCKTAVELQLIDDQLHLVADSPHFVEAEPMNLIRCHLCGREQTGLVLVIGLAIRQFGDADAVTACR